MQAVFRDHLSGVVAICEVANRVLRLEIGLCLDLTLRLTRSGNLRRSEVARRYGPRPQQVFAWRREARKQAASVQQGSPAFVPAVVAAAEPGPSIHRSSGNGKPPEMPA
ncbi:hypothetical protein EOA19_34545 [Mesorhizobium sp. M7A.F.Ca.US.010.02.1.1]|nr:hypothetical protein EOA19_34545 [Mesorhizobium sp. M7A.F.Ca.US.010.02.1.1]